MDGLLGIMEQVINDLNTVLVGDGTIHMLRYFFY